MNRELIGIKEWIDLYNQDDIYWMNSPSFTLCLGYKDRYSKDFDTMTLQEQKMFAEFVYYSEGGE